MSTRMKEQAEWFIWP